MTKGQDTGRILIVDDEQGLLFLLTQRLRSWGYEVLTAESGEDGLEMAQKHKPDLVLLDILMPKMKGREVCVALKADPSTRHIPVIFLTALGLPDHVKSGLEAGAEDYVSKTTDADQLRDRIRVCLARHRSPDRRP